MLYQHFAKVGAYQYEEQVWRRVAYVCRYAHQPLDLVLQLGARQLGLLQKAVSDIVREENDVKGS